MATLRILGQTKVDTVKNMVKSTLGVEIVIFDQNNNPAPGDVTLGSIRSRSPKQVEIRVVGQTLVQNVEKYFENNYGVRIEVLTGAGVKAEPDMTLGSVRGSYSLGSNDQSEPASMMQAEFAHDHKKNNKEQNAGDSTELQMQIKNFKLEEVASDDDYPITLEFTISNNTDDEVSRIKYDAFFLRGASHPVASSLDNPEECFLESGDSEEVSDTWRLIEKRLLKDDKTITALVQARVFQKETIQFGPFKLPQKSGVEYYEASIDNQTLGSSIGVTLYRHEADEDGDVRIDATCVVDNHTPAYLEDVELNIEVVDADGDEMDSGGSTNDVPSFSMVEIDPTIYVKTHI